jgi:hypothetical protein
MAELVEAVDQAEPVAMAELVEAVDQAEPVAMAELVDQAEPAAMVIHYRFILRNPRPTS